MQTHSNTGRLLRGEAGFTLVEMMMALLITAFVGAAILLAYQAQQKTQNVQEQVAELQANMRSAMSLISSDIRMIGFDPTCQAKAGFTKATRSEIQFTMNRTYEKNGKDDRDLTDANEEITYHLNEKDDPTHRGVVKSGSVSTLNRKARYAAGQGFQDEPVVRNVEAIEFLYKIGNDWYFDPKKSGKKLEEIKAVTVSMLIRTTHEDPKYTGDTRGLEPASGKGKDSGKGKEFFLDFNVEGNKRNSAWQDHVSNLDRKKDQHRRRVAISTVQLRNNERCNEEGL